MNIQWNHDWNAGNEFESDLMNSIVNVDGKQYHFLRLHETHDQLYFIFSLENPSNESISFSTNDDDNPYCNDGKRIALDEQKLFKALESNSITFSPKSSYYSYQENTKIHTKLLGELFSLLLKKWKDLDVMIKLWTILTANWAIGILKEFWWLLATLLALSDGRSKNQNDAHEIKRQRILKIMRKLREVLKRIKRTIKNK